jgi:hypothetical protein
MMKFYNVSDVERWMKTPRSQDCWIPWWAINLLLLITCKMDFAIPAGA